MWPKMLIELLPHLARVVPMWEKFLASRQANEKANETALQALADTVRGDLGQVTAAHAALYRQLQEQSAQIQEQSAQITLLVDEIQVTRVLASRVEEAALATQPVMASLALWIKGGVVAIILLLAVVIGLQWVHRTL